MKRSLFTTTIFLLLLGSVGTAQSWRNKARDESLRVQINTDPHSPADFRVNGVVRNIPEFYTTFNVKETDSLYLAPEERVKIW